MLIPSENKDMKKVLEKTVYQFQTKEKGFKFVRTEERALRSSVELLASANQHLRTECSGGSAKKKRI